MIRNMTFIRSSRLGRDLSKRTGQCRSHSVATGNSVNSFFVSNTAVEAGSFVNGVILPVTLRDEVLDFPGPFYCQAGHNQANDPATTRPYINASTKYFAVVDQGCPYQMLIGIVAQPKARKPTVETKRNTTI